MKDQNLFFVFTLKMISFQKVKVLSYKIKIITMIN